MPRQRKTNNTPVGALIHCLRCKKKTQSVGLEVKQSKNGRHRLAGRCADCGTSKSRFISNAEKMAGQRGEGFWGDLWGGIKSVATAAAPFVPLLL